MRINVDAKFDNRAVVETVDSVEGLTSVRLQDISCAGFGIVADRYRESVLPTSWGQA